MLSTKLLQSMKDIYPIIQNKYISVEELKNIITEMNLLLYVSIKSFDYMSNTTSLGLDVLFPVLEHLVLFISQADIGALALVSKTLYDQLSLTCTSQKIEICILYHYIHNDIYNKEVNIKFITKGLPHCSDDDESLSRSAEDFSNSEELLNSDGTFSYDNPEIIPREEQAIYVPLNLQLIALKKLRMLIGCENYFKQYYKTIFFKLDVIYVELLTGENLNHDNLVCIFCERSRGIMNKYHGPCKNEYKENNKERLKMFRKRKIQNPFLPRDKYTYVICPELEYIATKEREQTIPLPMRSTCNGIFNGGLKLDPRDKCNKCNLSAYLHKVKYNKII